jgi:Putative 2OG-Fe(II) oxygenase
MQTIEHALFPTLVLETFNEDHETMKGVFEDEIFKHLSDKGFSNELTGHLTMHHVPAFRPVFELATQAAKAYLETLRVDPDLYQFNVVKSWMNIVRERATPMHAHRDAHLSFVYYLNIPEDADMALVFEQDDYRHEPFAGCIKNAPPSEWTWLNSYTWSFGPKEGVMFVFPSSMIHGTPSKSGDPDTGIFTLEDYRKHRVAVAGDFLLTYKGKQAKSLGVQPIENWRVF